MRTKLLIVLAITGMLYTTTPLLYGQTIVNDVITLQAAIASATEGEIIQLSPSFPTTLTSAINATINHSNNFIVDGNGRTLGIGGNFRHFSITKTTSAGTFTLKNVELKGLRTNSNGISAGAAGGGVTINSSSKGIIEFDQVYFNSIQNGALAFMSLDAGAIVRVKNSTFRNNNKGDHGGGIFYRGSGNLEVLDCAFDENYNSGAGYSGGAIVCFNHTGQVSIRRSVFLNNLSVNWGGAIGVYSPSGSTSSVSIDSCYFEANRVTIASGNGDGGAVSVFGNAAQVTKFDLRNSTFYKNYASDDGGALFIQNYDTGAENYVVNCTMYENYADDVAPATSSSFNVATCGGAIQFSLKTPVTLENSTIIQNYTKSTYQRGGGIGFHAATTGAPIVILKNNIILGNYILSGSSKIYNTYANVGFKALLNPTVTQSGNIGYDNGTSLPANVTILNALGNDNPVKWDNFCSKKIGNPYESNVAYYRVSPTISVKPNYGTDVFGLADRQGVPSSLATDERGYLRDQANPGIGAVEIRWAKFDANGGDWASFPNLAYDGTTYYEKDGLGKVQNCYQITTHNGKISFPYNLPEKAGQVFHYWALDNVNGPQWDGQPLPITSNRTLYAIWRTGFLSFENDTICESEKADLTTLKPSSGSITPVTLNYYTDRLCTIPVVNPKAVVVGTYYIEGINASSYRDTTSVNIIGKKLAKLVLKLDKDTCLFQLKNRLILEISDTSHIIIAGTGKWILKNKEIDPNTYVLSGSDTGKMLYYQIDTECGIAQSNKIEIFVCNIIPEINRSVRIPEEVTGLKISMEPGIHYVGGHDDFIFTITPLPGYSLDGVTVKTNNPRWDNEGGVKLERIADDTLKVIIRQVTEPLELTIEGASPTANSAIDNTVIWTNGSQLFIDAEKPATLSVYTIYGSLYTQRTLSAGKTILSLPSGIYIVALDGKSCVKAVIK